MSPERSVEVIAGSGFHTQTLRMQKRSIRDQTLRLQKRAIRDQTQTVRLLRILGVALLVTAGPSTALIWPHDGATEGFVVLAAHLYVGLFALFGLPWLLARQARRRGWLD